MMHSSLIDFIRSDLDTDDYGVLGVHSGRPETLFSKKDAGWNIRCGILLRLNIETI